MDATHKLGDVMGRYSDESKQDILRQARETLAEIDSIQDAAPACRSDPIARVDHLADWRTVAEVQTQQHDLAQRELKAREEAIVNEQARGSKAWDGWFARKLAAALQARPFTKLQNDVLGAAISHERKRHRAELKTAIDDLRTELNGNKSGDSIPIRRRDVA